jgi:hypothetical protein
MKAMIMKTPLPIPAAPIPAIARPTISATEFGATPQIKLPISKMKTASRNEIFSGKNLYTFPQVDWKPPVVMRKAEPYQLASSRLWN